MKSNTSDDGSQSEALPDNTQLSALSEYLVDKGEDRDEGEGTYSYVTDILITTVKSIILWDDKSISASVLTGGVTMSFLRHVKGIPLFTLSTR